MTIKKIFAYILCLTAVLLGLSVFARLKLLVSVLNGLFQLITGNSDSYQLGYILGSLLIWALHITIVILLWRLGRRWMKAKPGADQ